jgi:hypothetical protein
MKKRGKKAQVSIFIIVGIVLLGIIFASYFIVNNNKNQSSKNSFSKLESKPGFENIKSFIIDCKETTIKQAVKNIGIQGGYYKKPGKYLNLEWTFIPYYYHEGEVLMPEKAEVESELSNAISENFASCIDKQKFEGFEISHEIAKTKSLINKGEIEFVIDMPLSIKKEKDITMLQMKDLPTKLNSPLFDILEIAKYITDFHKQNPNTICINCVSKMAEERDLYVFSLQIDNSSSLFIISGNNTATKENYYFEFLNKYSEPKIETFKVPEKS